MGGKDFWSQLINSKTVRDRQHVSMGNKLEPTPMGELPNGPRVEKFPFRILVNRLEIDDRLSTVAGCERIPPNNLHGYDEHRTAFAKAPNE